jgi:hypothetical protein
MANHLMICLLWRILAIIPIAMIYVAILRLFKYWYIYIHIWIHIGSWLVYNLDTQLPLKVLKSKPLPKSMVCGEGWLKGLAGIINTYPLRGQYHTLIHKSCRYYSGLVCSGKLSWNGDFGHKWWQVFQHKIRWMGSSLSRECNSSHPVSSHSNTCILVKSI